MRGDDLEERFCELWESLLPIGRQPGGGFRRYAWTPEDAAARAWFREAAARLGLSVEQDRNGILWAWWGSSPDADDAVVTGSHLDSVPDGGAYDGPLGVVSSLLAVERLQRRHAAPRRPLAIVVFPDEEGARFGVACAGSRLLTGDLEPDRARRLVDADGVRLADAVAGAGVDPAEIGRDAAALARIGAYVELHIEQGRRLAELGAPLGVATAIVPHGRWRLTFRGLADHAGTTVLADRQDPMLPLAAAVLAARDSAERLPGCVATVGRVEVEPNATNGIAAVARCWLDARGTDEDAVLQIVADVGATATTESARQRVDYEMSRESWSPAVDFDPRLTALVARLAGDAPLIPTAAGHDAGVLAPRVPAAMLFVRNPTGVSHSPDERAELPDCLAGVRALADVLAELAC